jgi:hypothetical protein
MRNLKIFIASTALVLIFGCQQEIVPEIIYDEPKEILNWEDQIQNVDSVLHFKSWSALESVNSKVSSLEFIRLEGLSKQKSFSSQLYLYNKILNEEENRENEAFKKFEHLTEIELLKLKMPRLVHTDIYKKHVKSGMIAVEEDNDTASVYFLSTLSPTISGVLNEYGVVVIADTVYQFSNSQIKRAPLNKLENWRNLLNMKISIPEKGVDISTQQLNTRALVGWNWTGNTNKQWTSAGTNKRARYTRFGSSSTNTWSVFSQAQFYLRVEAESRLCGSCTYQKRNSYRPTFVFNGNWTGQATAVNCSNGLSSLLLTLNQFPAGTGVTASPMVNRTFQGNYGLILLHPHTTGYWQLTHGKCWEYPFNVSPSNITIHGTVSGGTSGYTLTSG